MDPRRPPLADPAGVPRDALSQLHLPQSINFSLIVLVKGPISDLYRENFIENGFSINVTPNDQIQHPTVAFRVPLPSVRRLPLYLRVLHALQEKGQEAVSCTVIAGELRMDPTQVRKDLSITGIIGKPKVGYSTHELIDAIEEFLGWKNTTDAFLVGVGSLGTALLGYRDFAQYGVNIVAAFDCNPAKVGKKVRGRDVLPLEKLTDLVQRMHIHIGVLAVPPEAAQTVADLMVKAGILAIWNFAPVQVNVPPGIIVERADFTPSLAALTSRLRALVSGKNEITPTIQED